MVNDEVGSNEAEASKRSEQGALSYMLCAVNWLYVFVHLAGLKMSKVRLSAQTFRDVHAKCVRNGHKLLQ